MFLYKYKRIRRLTVTNIYIYENSNIKVYSVRYIYLIFDDHCRLIERLTKQTTKCGGIYYSKCIS